jgi:hypothetical protein
VPINLNKKLSNPELAHKYWLLCKEINALFVRWSFTESDIIWDEYWAKRHNAELLRSTINNRTEAA